MLKRFFQVLKADNRFLRVCEASDFDLTTTGTFPVHRDCPAIAAFIWQRPPALLPVPGNVPARTGITATRPTAASTKLVDQPSPTLLHTRCLLSLPWRVKPHFWGTKENRIKGNSLHLQVVNLLHLPEPSTDWNSCVAAFPQGLSNVGDTETPTEVSKLENRTQIGSRERRERNHRITEWFMIFKDPLIQPSCHGQGHISLNQDAQKFIRPNLEHFQ